MLNYAIIASYVKYVKNSYLMCNRLFRAYRNYAIFFPPK